VMCAATPSLPVIVPTPNSALGYAITGLPAGVITPPAAGPGNSKVRCAINAQRYSHGPDAAITPVTPDADAVYERVVEIDVSGLAPQIACPHTVDNVKNIGEVAGKAVQQIVIGSCTNGRLDDLAIAAGILRGKKVAEGTRMLVFPASTKIFAQAMDKGYIQDFMKAGAVVMNSGCGPCLGVHEGALGDDEVARSTTNRNFKGRMGNPKSEVYLCSPATAAASAITGVITDPRKG